VHFVDLATGLIVAVAHITKQGARSKEKSKDAAVLKAWSDFVVIGHKGSSGAMDQVGTKLCTEWLIKYFPEDAEFVLLCRDGDVKAVKASGLCTGTTKWLDARCKGHIGKNLRKWIANELSKVKCDGRCRITKCKGRADSKVLALRASGRFYQILHDAVALYLPEIRNPLLLKKLVYREVLSDERKKLRLEAIKYAARELRAMFDHFRGHHNHCRHGDLPATHPKVSCPAQLAALSKHVDDLIAQLPDILTLFGLVDVNRVEVSSRTFICTCLHLTITPRQSNHAAIRLFRPKGEKWPALACFLAENMAILDIQYLRLQCIDFPGGDPVIAPPLAFIAELNKRFQTNLALSERQLADIERRNSDRLRGMGYRNSEKGKETRAALKNKSHRSQAEQASEVGPATYVSGGGEKAAEANDATLRELEEIQWCGGDEDTHDNTETEAGYGTVDSEQRAKEMMESVALPRANTPQSSDFPQILA